MTCITTYSKDRSQQCKVRSQPFSYDHAKTEHNKAKSGHNLLVMTIQRQIITMQGQVTTSQKQITTMQSQVTTFRLRPCKDRSQQGKVRSQHFSHHHAKTDHNILVVTDLNHATTDHIHTLTTTHRLLTLSQITAMHTEAGSTRHHLFCHPPASHERWKHALHLSEHVASQLLVSQQLWLQWQLEKNKSGYKMFSSSEEIVWTNIQWYV